MITNLPDWITRNNSQEKINSLINKPFDPADHMDVGPFGVLVIVNDLPQIIAMGLIEDDATDIANIVRSQQPEWFIEIFKSIKNI